MALYGMSPPEKISHISTPAQQAQQIPPFTDPSVA